MRRRIYFDEFDQIGWPAPRELKRFFVAPKGKQWSYLGGNDNWGLKIESVGSTEHLDLADPRRIDVRLNMWAHPELGVLLIYEKVGGGYGDAYSSKGDLTPLNKWVRTLHGDPMPVGLYIPFEEAWKAVKEFMETDGKLPTSIEWIENSKLPPGTFPPP